LKRNNSKDKAMKSIYKQKGNRGFTLVEVIISTFLFVTALLGVVSTTVIIMKSDSRSMAMTTATTLAKDKMEQSKNAGYNGLTTGDFYDYADKDSTVRATSAADTVYTRKRTVTDSAPAANMKTVTVTVSWSWGILPGSVVMNTIIAK